MFLQWRSPEDYATNVAIVVLAMAGLTIIMIDHQTKSRQKRLAAALTQGFWKFTPVQVDDLKQKKLNWMKLFLAGVMISCTSMSITVKFLKVAKAVMLSSTILIGWATFLSLALNVKSLTIEEKRVLKEKADSEGNVELIGWRAKLKVSTLTEDKRLPVTIVTGFLGSGKTTLVKKVLENTVGIKVLVIENEIGVEGIDHELLLQHTDKEEIILMNNGCICCTVRKDLITTFHSMFADESFSKLDWVMIETTGLADPAPLIQSLYMDKECSKYLRLDSVLTVVDAKHLPQHIEQGKKKDEKISSVTNIENKDTNGNNNGTVNVTAESANKRDIKETKGVHGGLPEAAMQIIFSDRIILNKIDLVSKETLRNIESRVRELNPTAQIIPCEFSNVPVQDLLNIRAFDPSRNAALLTQEEEEKKKKESMKSTDNNNNNSENLKITETKKNDNIEDRKIDKNIAKSGFIRYDENGKILPSKLQVKNGGSDSQTTDLNSVSTISLVTYESLDLDIFNIWVSALLRLQGANIFRLKGILNMHGYDNQFVVQGVHMIFDGEIGPKWDDLGSDKNSTSSSDQNKKEISGKKIEINGDKIVVKNVVRRRSRLVLIGKGLDWNVLQAGFLACEHRVEEEEDN
jgi:G3E family GTPase/putative Mn2+ efflux pump MntP